MIKSPWVIAKALNNPSARSILEERSNELEQYLIENIAIEFPSNELINISLYGQERDLPESVAIVDAVTQAYFELIQGFSAILQGQLLTLLEDERQANERDIRDIIEKKEQIESELATLEVNRPLTSRDRLDLEFLQQDIDAMMKIRQALRDRIFFLSIERMAPCRITRASFAKSHRIGKQRFNK